MRRLPLALALILTGITFVAAGLVLAKVKVELEPEPITWAGAAW